MDFYEDYQEGREQLPSLAPQKELTTSQPDASPVALTQTVTDTFHGGNELDIIASMTDRISNSLVLGISGTGKGMLISNALRVAKSKHPKLRIFYVDPKNDPKEYGYTEGVADIVKRYKCETESPDVVIKWLQKCFEEFNEYAIANDKEGYRTLLVLDEGTVLGLKSKLGKSTLLIDRLSSLTSLGDVAGKNIWFVAQSPFVGGSGIDLSASSQLVTIALVSSENVGAMNQWKRAAMFKQPTNLDELIEKSEVKRAVYFGKTGEWYSMPKLTNYSNFDRDTRQDISSIESKLTPVEELERLFSISEQPTTIQDEVQINTDPRLLNCILDKIISSESITFDTLKKHIQRNLPELSKIELIRGAIAKLITEELIQGNETDGYSIT